MRAKVTLEKSRQCQYRSICQPEWIDGWHDWGRQNLSKLNQQQFFRQKREFCLIKRRVLM